MIIEFPAFRQIEMIRKTAATLRNIPKPSMASSEFQVEVTDQIVCWRFWRTDTTIAEIEAEVSKFWKAVRREMARLPECTSGGAA